MTTLQSKQKQEGLTEQQIFEALNIPYYPRSRSISIDNNFLNIQNDHFNNNNNNNITNNNRVNFKNTTSPKKYTRPRRNSYQSSNYRNDCCSSQFQNKISNDLTFQQCNNSNYNKSHFKKHSHYHHHHNLHYDLLYHYNHQYKIHNNNNNLNNIKSYHQNQNNNNNNNNNNIPNKHYQPHLWSNQDWRVLHRSAAAFCAVICRIVVTSLLTVGWIPMALLVQIIARILSPAYRFTRKASSAARHQYHRKRFVWSRARRYLRHRHRISAALRSGSSRIGHTLYAAMRLRRRNSPFSSSSSSSTSTSSSMAARRSRLYAVQYRRRYRTQQWVLDGARFLFIGLFLPLVLLYRLNKRSETGKDITPFQLSLLRQLPLRGISRMWGRINTIRLPIFLREVFYRVYAAVFGVNLEEVEQPLEHYPSLQDFFTRKLKPGVRPLCKYSQIVSPVDGTVSRFGAVPSEGRLEQIKGVTYGVEEFLRTCTPNGQRLQVPETQPGNQLYYCTIYLAPGDYHRFHSPAEWTCLNRNHITGALFPVMPAVVRVIQGLFAINERVVLSGLWEHGFFSYTAVGATNVGSIVLPWDHDLQTNRFITYAERKQMDRYRHSNCKRRHHAAWGPCYNKILDQSKSFKRGEDVGWFRLGSTVVLVFEAPKSIQFNVKSGQKVNLGESLASIK